MAEQALDLPRPPTSSPAETAELKQVAPTNEQPPLSSEQTIPSPISFSIPQTPDMPPRENEKPPTTYGTAEFLPKIRDLLSRCGIDPSIVNPVPIGAGANHIVYLATPKTGEQFVIKIPKSNSLTTMNRGHEDETEQIQKIQKAFPGYTLNTETKIDPETHRYLVIQKAVLGDPITNKITDPSLKAQLSEIIALNQNLFKQYGESLDFVGMPGFISWIKHQFRKLINRTSEFEISNLRVDVKTNRIYIIDTDVLRLKNASLRTALISRLGFFVNRLLMKHYFGLDIKKAKK